MVNCKGIANTPNSPVNQICRYCRTRMCEECYLAATNKNAMQPEPTSARHQHVCLACIQTHPEAKELRSPPRERHPSRLARLNSAPVSGGPRIDSLSNMAREHSGRSKPIEDQTAAKPTELSTFDRRRRRHTSAITPTSRSVDFSCPGRSSKARQLLKANATELQVARRQQNATELHTSRQKPQAPTHSCDFTARIATRDPSSTGSKLSVTDLKSQSCDLTGSKPIVDVSDEPTDLELSTVDLRLPKYQANIPTPMKGGRRFSAADPINSALTPISIENLAAIDAKLSCVELELKRYEVSPKDTRKPKAPTSVSSSKSVDLQLPTVDLRPRQRRHTTDTFKQKAQEQPLKEIQALVQRKKKAEPIDFHLSTFDLKPGGKRKEKQEKKKASASEQAAPVYSKDEPCDLAYLENFRLYTV